MSRAAKVVAAVAVDELTERQARAEHKRLAEEIAHHDKLYHEQDSPEISDADYDKLRQRLKAIEARFPAARRHVQPDPAGGADADHGLRQGQACAADAVARQRLFRGGSAGLLRPPAPCAGARDRPQAGRRDRAGLRAQDRRALDQPALRGRRLHRRRHARRRHDRRGRHRQSAHGEGHPAQAEGQVAQGDRRARRDLHGAQGVPGDEQAPGSGWREGLRQSAQRRRGLAAPARSGDHREPAAALLRLCLGRGRAALMEDPQRVPQAPEGLGLQGQSAVQALPHARARCATSIAR